jgi:hypothetical protein
MLQPKYLVTLGEEKLTAENGSNLISIRTYQGIGLPIDSCEITLARGSYTFKKNDPIKVEIGYNDRTQSAFSGLVTAIDQDLYSCRVTGLGYAVNLLRLRLNRVYLDQTAGKIVSSLAQEANVKTKTVEDGIKLPSYVINESSNGYEHILKLADRCNFNVYIDDDQLMFRSPEQGKSTNLYFGKQIIEIKESNFTPLLDGVKIQGESPSSFKGSDTSHWLTKQDVKGEAGGSVIRSMHDPALKDKETAESVAKSKNIKLTCSYGVTVSASLAKSLSSTINFSTSPPKSSS